MDEFSNFLIAADNHNYGNVESSWLDPETWMAKFGNAGKLAATSVLSGVNSFYNTGATVASWAGADVEQNDTEAWISGIDSDLGAYYRQNQSSADLGGFILGSLIPGLGGVKVFNAGQKALQAATKTGYIGGNLSKATGLLVPNVERSVALAAQELNGASAAMRLLNKNTAIAIGKGFWQNTLEAAAFETAVQSTMFKSPILEPQDKMDIATNILVGGALGGIIGGAFTTAGIFGKLKTAVKREDSARKAFDSRPSFASITSPSERIVSLAFDSEMATVPVAFKSVDGEGLVTNNYAVDKKLFDDKLRRNDNDIRAAINELSGNDSELGNILANGLTPNLTPAGSKLPGSSTSYLETFSGAVGVTRINGVTKAEEAFTKKLKENPLEAGIGPQARYYSLIGEDAGSVYADKPLLPSLADLYAGKQGVLNAVSEYGFKFGKEWNALDLVGKARGHLEAEARHIWAMKETTKIPENASIGKYDIPLLERAHKDGRLDISIVDPTNPLLIVRPSSNQDLFDILKEAKLEVAAKVVEKGTLSKGGKLPIEVSMPAAAKIANVKLDFLEGTKVTQEVDDFFAHQSLAYKYKLAHEGKGLSKTVGEYEDPLFLPKYAKVVYEPSENVPETVVDAITYFKSKQREYTETAKIVTAKVLGERAENFPDISDTALYQASRTGSGATLFSAQNGNYGSLDSAMAWIGSNTQAAIQESRKAIGDSFAAPLTRLVQNPKAAIEFEAINRQVARSPKQWVIDEERNALISVEKNSDVDAEIIPIENEETWEAVKEHIRLSGGRTDGMREIRAAQGHTDMKNANVFRPIRPDLKQYPHFAFVVDPTVTGTNHTSMIHAASEKELAELIDRVPQNYKVLTKTDTEEFYRARNEFEFQRTLHENYINSDLTKKGVFSNFFPKTDPQKIVDDILQQHYRESDVLVREAVRLRYEPQFNYLEDLGKSYGKVDTSRFATRAEIIEQTSDNPYFNYIKTALNISKASEYHLIHSANKLLDTAVSKAVGSIRNVFESVKTPADLGKINAELQKYGMQPAYYDAALNLLANHTAPRGELTKFVRSANSLLSLFTLGLDPINSLNNAIGSNILRMTELRHLTKAIQAGNADVAGELSQIAKISLPGVGDEILAPTKLVAQAINNFWKDDGTLLAKYKSAGYIKDRVEQLKLLVEDFTLTGTETVKDLNQRLDGAFAKAKGLAEKGESLSGNKLAEEFNRFISANVMDQITGIGIKNGLIDEATAKAYVNTFVNRVEGNIIASQRPLIFQGPIGQAVGLFQSYQFNLLQQLFRYSAEGSKKDIGLLLGLQSTLYGLQSLPAFQAINTHIVGQLSGNKDHRDAYDAIYGMTGRRAGDFLLYGAPSNILQANIYSRGDINPRQVTVLPTSLQEIPIVQGWGKFLGSMKETAGKIMAGGNVWESLLQGLEHNGISRPLAGFAQVLQAVPGGTVYSTSNKGSILYSNDLFSWASAVRMAGARPIDEAIVNDALYRVKTYESSRRASMASLAETVKTTLIQDEKGTEEQVMKFAQKYAELGGKQAGFNKWMMQLYKNANVSQAQQLESSLKNPFAHKMQLLMGGDEQ